jgi:hypothetical protein
MKSCHYFPIYERHFSRFRNLDVTIFEIGVWQGGSMQLWKKYFGPYAKIVGIDVEEKCTGAEEDQISVRIGDQSDCAFLDRVVEEFGVPDIVVDDGSHQSKHINVTFDHLYPKQPKNSIYLVEDTFFSYWEKSGGVGAGPCESFIERTKSMIDSLHANYTRGKINASEFTHTTSGIHIYDGVVVFEKRGSIKRISVTGDKQLFGEVIDDNTRRSEELMKLIYRSA